MSFKRFLVWNKRWFEAFCFWISP